MLLSHARPSWGLRTRYSHLSESRIPPLEALKQCAIDLGELLRRSSGRARRAAGVAEPALRPAVLRPRGVFRAPPVAQPAVARTPPPASAARAAPSCVAAHAASSRARAASSGSASARPTASRSGRGRDRRRGRRTPTPGPVHPRRVLVHVARRRAGDDRAAAGQRAHERAVARRGRRRRRSAASCARRTPTRPAARSAGTATGGSGAAPVPRRQHAHRRVRQPLERRAQQPVLGVLRRRGRDEHERLVARRQLHVLERRLPQQRPDDVRPTRGQSPRVLELRERRRRGTAAADPAVHAVERAAARGARASR